MEWTFVHTSAAQFRPEYIFSVQQKGDDVVTVRSYPPRQNVSPLTLIPRHLKTIAPEKLDGLHFVLKLYV